MRTLWVSWGAMYVCVVQYEISGGVASSNYGGQKSARLVNPPYTHPLSLSPVILHFPLRPKRT